MDFIDNLNESYDLIYEEMSELGDPVLMIIDIDKDMQHSFYPEDLKTLREFLTEIKKHPNLTLEKDINESYRIKNYGMTDGEESVLVLYDIDNGEEHNFYPKDVKKLEAFLLRLIEFKVIR